MSINNLYWVDIIMDTVYPCSPDTSAKVIDWGLLVQAKGTTDAWVQARRLYGITGLTDSRVNSDGD